MTDAATRAASDLDAVFAALADPTRRAIVVRLVTGGPATATTLSAAYPISRQAVVKHLQALEAARMVTAERAGREVRYRADPAPLASVVGWLLDAGASWDRRLDRLRTVRRGRSSTAAAR